MCELAHAAFEQQSSWIPGPTGGARHERMIGRPSHACHARHLRHSNGFHTCRHPLLQILLAASIARRLALQAAFPPHRWR